MPKIINVTVFSPAVDFWIWAVSLVLVICGCLATKLYRPMSLPKWVLLPCVATLAAMPAFLADVWLASLLIAPLGIVAVSSAAYTEFGLGRGRRLTLFGVMIGIFGLLLCVQLVSLGTWLFNVFDYEFPFTSVGRWSFAWIDVQLFNVLYPLTASLFLILLFGWVWLPLGRRLMSKLHAPKIDTASNHNRELLGPSKLSGRKLWLGLAAVLAVAAFVGAYSLVHAQSSTLVGTDSIDYYNWLLEMNNRGSLFALQSDRPLSLLFLRSIQVLTFQPAQIIVLALPIICAVALSFAVFLFVHFGTKNDVLALLSSLFTVVAFQVTVGVFAYSVSNWLALVEVFFLLAIMLRAFETQQLRYWLASRGCTIAPAGLLANGTASVPGRSGHASAWSTRENELDRCVGRRFCLPAQGKWRAQEGRHAR